MKLWQLPPSIECYSKTTTFLLLLASNAAQTKLPGPLPKKINKIILTLINLNKIIYIPTIM